MKLKYYIIFGAIFLIILIAGTYFIKAEYSVSDIFNGKEMSFKAMQQEGVENSINIDGLTFENINATFFSGGINFETSYLNMNLTPKQVFVPDELSNLATLSGYNYVVAPTGELVEWTGYVYDVSYCDWNNNPCIYPHKDLDRILGNGYNSDSKYPQTYFQLGAYSSSLARDNQTVADVFDYDFNLKKTRYNVSWAIEVSSHYEHILVKYKLYYTEEGKEPELILLNEEMEFLPEEDQWTFMNVYSRERPDLFGVNYQLNRYTRGEVFNDRASLSIDNLYRDEKNVTIVVAVPNNKEILELSFPNDYFEVEGNYNLVVGKANELGKNSSLLDNPNDFKINFYNTTLLANQVNTFNVFIPSELGEENLMSIWALGSFAGGSGTSGDPYQITNCSNLNETRNDLTASYILMNDINCSETSSWNSGTGWLPIGDATTPFNGTFNGQNYTISNLYISENVDVKGLFGKIGSVAVVSDTILKNFEVRGRDNIGSLTGYNEGEILRCHSYNVSISSAASYRSSYGGLVGYNQGLISKSSTSGNVNGGSGSSIGGLAGYNIGTIEESKSNASIVQTYSLRYYIGGLVGNQYTEGIINNSYSTGNITAEGTSVGGLVGRHYKGKILNSYSTGKPTGDSSVGGLTGSHTTGGIYEVANSLWDINTSETETSSSGAGKPTIEMQDIDTFSAWDIAEKSSYDGEVWFIDDGNDYPRLGWEFEESGEESTSFTVSLPFGYTEINFSANQKTVSNLNAEGQNETNSVLTITNSGNVNLDIYFKTNQTNENINLTANNNNNSAEGKLINTTIYKIVTGLTPSNEALIWMWISWESQTPATKNTQLNISVNKT